MNKSRGLANEWAERHGGYIADASRCRHVGVEERPIPD